MWSVDEYQRVFEHCVRITSSLDEGDVAAAAAAAVSETLDGSGVFVCRFERDRLSIAAADPQISGVREIAIGHGPVGRALATRQPVYLPDLSKETPASELPPGAGPSGTLLAVPLSSGDEVLGLIYAVSPDDDAFPEAHRAVVLSLAPTVAAAINNARVFDERQRSWERERALDERKALFIWLVSEDLLGPLVRLREMVGSLALQDQPALVDVATKMMVEARDVTATVERILHLSTGHGLKESAGPVDVVRALSEIGRARSGDEIVALTHRERLQRVVAHLVPIRTDAMIETDDDHVRIRVPALDGEARMFNALARIAGGTSEGNDTIVLRRP